MSEELKAVIFDVDGTLGQTERHGHRVAFNRAFEQYGLEDRWDEKLYGELLRVTGGVRRIKHYFADYKSVPEHEAQRLGEKIHPVKTNLFVEVVRGGEVPERPGVLGFLKELEADGLRLGVATTGTRAWVHPLVAQIAGRAGIRPFEVIVTGDDVKERKPDPEAFFLALEQLGVQAPEAVIVEDSRNGVVAAKAANCVCLAVKGEYSDTEQLRDADLVVGEFAESDGFIEVLHNPFDISVGPRLTSAVVRSLHAVAAVRHGSSAED